MMHPFHSAKKKERKKERKKISDYYSRKRETYETHYTHDVYDETMMQRFN